MQVVCNGQPMDVAEGSSVAVLLEELGLGRRVVVVERNGQPVDRSAMAEVLLDEGDRLEVVRAVAGG